MQEVNQPDVPVLVAIDNSGSTEGHAFYHNYIIDLLQKQHGQLSVVEWNTSISEVSTATCIENRRHCHNNGGTSPSIVANYVIKHNFVGKLIIVSDGQVDVSDVDSCDNLLRNYRFANTEVHLINNGQPPN